MERVQEAHRLPQHGDDARVRPQLRYAPGGGAGDEVGRRSLANALAGLSPVKQRQILLERRRIGTQFLRARVQLWREEPCLLELGHEDLRMTSEELVERRGAALGMTDDEEVGKSLVQYRNGGRCLGRGHTRNSSPGSFGPSSPSSPSSERCSADPYPSTVPNLPKRTVSELLMLVHRLGAVNTCSPPL